MDCDEKNSPARKFWAVMVGFAMLYKDGQSTQSEIMRYRLPPMNALRIFETAGRHLSFKDAARELEITPSAISHGVQRLEEWLGQPLFARRREGLAFTKTGAHYFQAATGALRCLAEGVEALPGARARGKLTVSAAPTFAARMLLPRLYELRQGLSHVSVQIDTSPNPVEFKHSDVDVAIRLGTGSWDGLESVHLLTEILVPVCSPALKERLGETLDDPSQAPLIHLTAVSQDWQAWLEATGQSGPDLTRGFMVDTIQLAIAAAVQGLGVCIGRRPLIDTELAAGTLVECGSAVECQTSYYLVAPSTHFRRSEVLAFKEWLLTEVVELPRAIAMPQQLPPLNSLRVFEAAARLGNYRLVAEELHVTASAVSHSILTLEKWFGATLFERDPQGLRLTAFGEAFLPSVIKALELISGATDQVAGSRSSGRLSLGCEPAFASRWLVPRLPQFAERYPGVSISIDTLGNSQAHASDTVDLEIRYSEKPPTGVRRTRLLRDTLFPVIAPELAGGSSPEKTNRLLRRLPLLRLVTRPDEWDHWLNVTGVKLEDKADDLKFGTVQMALEAAKQGLGIAMGRCLLVEVELASGNLVPMSLPKVAAPSSYWLVGAGPTLERRETRAFRRWLLEEMRASRSRAESTAVISEDDRVERRCA